MRPTPAKILQHSEGLGTPDAETVRRRAQEVALINGRQEFNDDDWQQALCELHGGHDGDDGDGEIHAVVSEHDMVAGDVGHHIENMGPDDDNVIGAELLAEGMDEALHDRMLAERREHPEETDEDDE